MTNPLLELDKLAISVDVNAKKAYQRVMKLIEEGTPPQVALDIVYKSFAAGSFNAGFAELLAHSLTNLLHKPFTPQEVLNMRVGGLSLSTKIYIDSIEISKKAVEIINDHLQGIQNLRKLALDLFSGYDQKSIELLKFNNPLPKYLKNPVDTALARMLASDLKTPALKAAYLQYIDKLEMDAGKKALERMLKTAIYEKSRYLSSRIAITEAARAYAKAQGKKIIKDTNQYVQIRPSGGHEVDMCDAFIEADHYGLGAGIYPKSSAPVPPFHPHCKCRQISLVNVETKEEPPRRQEATRDYFNSLSDEDQKLMFPTQAMRDEIARGDDPLEVLNRRIKNNDYRIRTIAETF